MSDEVRDAVVKAHELPVLSSEAHEAWLKAQPLLKPTAKGTLALYWLLSGCSYKEACDHAQLASVSSLRRLVHRVGIGDAVAVTRDHRTRLHAIHERASERLVERLDDDAKAEEISARDLSTIGAQASKTLEGIEGQGDQSKFVTALEGLRDGLSQGGTLRLKVEVEVGSPDDDVVDVTPSE